MQIHYVKLLLRLPNSFRNSHRKQQRLKSLRPSWQFEDIFEKPALYVMAALFQLARVIQHHACRSRLLLPGHSYRNQYLQLNTSTNQEPGFHDRLRCSGCGTRKTTCLALMYQSLSASHRLTE